MMIGWWHFRHVLHKYANEDVSLGSWFIGLDVEHVDDRRLCCGTPPGMPDAFPSVCLAYIHSCFLYTNQLLSTCDVSGLRIVWVVVCPLHTHNASSVWIIWGNKPFGVVDGQLQKVGAPSAVISMCLPTLFVLTTLVSSLSWHETSELSFWGLHFWYDWIWSCKMKKRFTLEP